MVQVMRRTSHLAYTECRLLTSLKGGKMPKFCLFQCTKTADVFIGQMGDGCWEEADLQNLVQELNGE